MLPIVLLRPLAHVLPCARVIPNQAGARETGDRPPFHIHIGAPRPPPTRQHNQIITTLRVCVCASTAHCAELLPCAHVWMQICRALVCLVCVHVWTDDVVLITSYLNAYSNDHLTERAHACARERVCVMCSGACSCVHKTKFSTVRGG